MQQDLKCADARHLIHLAVGDDLLEAEDQQLAEHLLKCSACRTYHSEMDAASHVLQQVRDDVPDTVQQSVWPELSRQLKKQVAPRVQVSEGRRFNVAVATLCACSIILAFVTAVQNLPSADEAQYVSAPINPSTNVSFGANLPTHEVGMMPQLDTARLVPVRQPNGQLILIDPLTNQSFVPANVPMARQQGAFQF